MMASRRKSEAEIRADIQRLRHQLVGHKLTRVQTELAACRQEVETLRAELRNRPRDADQAGANSAG